MVADSQTAELACEVANPSAEGKWLKDGQPLDFNDNVLGRVNGCVRSLVIIITKVSDVGEYTYQIASSKTSAYLKVEGKPRPARMRGWTALESETGFGFEQMCPSDPNKLNHYT